MFGIHILIIANDKKIKLLALRYKEFRNENEKVTAPEKGNILILILRK